MTLRNAANRFLALIFPPRCPWCGAVPARAARCRCEEGKDAPRPPASPIVPDAAAGHVHLDAIWACYEYEGRVRDAILRFKFQGGRALAEPFAACMAARLAKTPLAGQCLLIVPTPVSAATKRRRGYSQCALIAARLATKTSLPWQAGALVKTMHTTPQMSLARARRLTNVQNAFRAVPELVSGRHILLVDDIVTTGSTLDACAKALLDAGAGRVSALCLAHTPPHSPGTEDAPP